MRASGLHSLRPKLTRFRNDQVAVLSIETSSEIIWVLEMIRFGKNKSRSMQHEWNAQDLRAQKAGRSWSALQVIGACAKPIAHHVAVIS